MKTLLCLMFMVTSAYAQDPAAYLKTFDSKIYSLKNKGVNDFVVDIENKGLTKHLNQQQIFGKVEDVTFRVYWTANPERMAIEIIGLPEGFIEIKEELKMSIMGVMDNLLPQTMAQRFNGYKFTMGNKAKEIQAQDTSGMAPIPAFHLTFDEQDRLKEVKAIKPIGSMVVQPEYEKTSFSDGKLVLKEQTTVTIENGQTLTVNKELEYGDVQGIGVLSEVEIETTHKSTIPEEKTVSASETITFKNYKINSGDALKYFLGEAKAAPPKQK